MLSWECVSIFLAICWVSISAQSTGLGLSVSRWLFWSVGYWKMLKWILHWLEGLISELFAHDGKWLSTSASNISLPGQYIMTMSYCCRRNSIRCKQLELRSSFSNWSSLAVCDQFLPVKDLPYKYVWNFLQPKTIASSSLLMFAYLVSVSVKLLLANAMGLLSWIMHAPRPFSDASHCRVTGLFLS